MPVGPRRHRRRRARALRRRHADPHPVAPVAHRRRAVRPSARRRAGLGGAARRAGRRGRLRRRVPLRPRGRSGRCRAWPRTGSSTPGTASKTLAPGLRLGWLVLPPRPGRRRRRGQAARRPRLGRPRPAGLRRLPGPRRVRPPPAPDAPGLPAPPRRAARRAAPGTCPSCDRPGSPPGCTWWPGSRRTSTRRPSWPRPPAAASRVHGVTPFRLAQPRTGRADLRLLLARRARDRRGGRPARRGRRRAAGVVPGPAIRPGRCAPGPSARRPR